MCKWCFAEFFIFSNGGHLGLRPGSSDISLKDDPQRPFHPSLGPIWPVVSEEIICKWFLSNFLFLVTESILVGFWGRRTQFSKRTSWRPFRHSLGPIGTAVMEKIIVKWFFAEFSIFSNGIHLAWRGNCRTQFWKGTTQRPFHQSLVQIGRLVLEELI